MADLTEHLPIRVPFHKSRFFLITEIREGRKNQHYKGRGEYANEWIITVQIDGQEDQSHNVSLLHEPRGENFFITSADPGNELLTRPLVGIEPHSELSESLWRMRDFFREQKIFGYGQETPRSESHVGGKSLEDILLQQAIIASLRDQEKLMRAAQGSSKIMSTTTTSKGTQLKWEILGQPIPKPDQQGFYLLKIKGAAVPFDITTDSDGNVWRFNLDKKEWEKDFHKTNALNCFIRTNPGVLRFQQAEPHCCRKMPSC